MSWPTTIYNGVEYYQFAGITLIPVDPSTGVAMIILKPDGMAVGVGIPAVETGPGGQPANIDPTINFTALAWDDPTPDSASWTVLTPPTDETPGLYRLVLSLHTGEPGDTGTVAIDLTTIGGTAAAGEIIRVNSSANGFDFGWEKVGDRFIPTTGGVFDIATTQANNTSAQIAIPFQKNDFRVEVSGSTIVTATGGGDVHVDLVAHLGAIDGPVIGYCHGMGGTERLILDSGPPAGSADAYDRIAAASSGSTTVYLRTEYQGGADSYNTSKATTRFKARVCPIP